jgi:hypothetical protein
MKLGEMLVRDGRLTEPQLQAALAAQVRDGGRLGTVLVEHGLIDLEALTVYLGLELGIPIATGAMLERAKRAAVRMIQAPHAFRYKCVPLVVQDRQLIAAIEDPHDFATLEAITQATGYRVLPRIAPEVRIYYYIERYYGVPRPARFVRFGDTPRGDDSAPDAGLPAPPLPGLPPVPVAPVPAPVPASGPRPRLRSVKMPTISVPFRNDKFDDSEALELDAEDLIDSLDADDAAPAEAAPIAESVPVAPPSGGPATTPPPVGPKPMGAPEALAELANANDRNRIVELMLSYAASVFDGGVVFTVRDDLAFGWKAFGQMPGHARIEYMLIPLNVPSVVQAAVADDTGIHHGPVTPSTVNAYLYKCLGIADPAFATSGAIRIGKRLVNVFYAHASKELTQLELTDVQQICQAAAEAYARLIAAVKKKRE